MSESYVDIGAAGWHSTLCREGGVPVRLEFWQCPGLPECPLCEGRERYRQMSTLSYVPDPRWDALAAPLSADPEETP